jgi:hypothetical protein
MNQGRIRGFSAAEKIELWNRWQRGETLKAIGRAFDKLKGFLRPDPRVPARIFRLHQVNWKNRESHLLRRRIGSAGRLAIHLQP